ncbi:hypothetical protein [Billgrantia endophytica]|uniref:Conjugal transfer protein n=1 Tax=Billgrantia endophytica TaxID=2033802 RepID=A0A2N7TUE4_9GAMM|nr:hypothetical protein [Halomonas endophytica]PMR71804.1 hypothetical protein C1H69_22995 [Halomonas endophytica]
MKKLLLALPLSTLLLSTAQAQQNTEQDLLDSMLYQMTGQLQGKQTNPADNPLLQALEAEKQERRVSVESNRLSKPLASFDSNRDRQPISRSFRDQ